MVAAMIHDEAEIERRKPVWLVLSELWFDTKLTEDDLQRIAGVMQSSGYSVPELREIYRESSLNSTMTCRLPGWGKRLGWPGMTDGKRRAEAGASGPCCIRVGERRDPPDRRSLQ